MDFNHVIKSRHSTTSFKKHIVSWKPLMEAIHDSIQGPFAGNYNNLKFIIIEDPETITRLAEFAHQLWIANSPAVIVVCSDETQPENLYGERGRVYSRQQAGAAINTITMSLANKGIQSCWVGAYDDNSIRMLLKIPGHVQIDALIPTGYSAQKRQVKSKAKLDACVRWENWDGDRRPSLFNEGAEQTF